MSSSLFFFSLLRFFLINILYEFFSLLSFTRNYIKVRFFFFLFLCFFHYICFFIFIFYVLNNCMNVVVGFVFSYEINVVVALFFLCYLFVANFLSWFSSFFSKQLNSEYYGVLIYI
jgi:hypothetical protein